MSNTAAHHRVDYTAEYVALQSAGLLGNSRNNGVLTEQDHFAFDAAMESEENGVDLADAAAVLAFDPTANKISKSFIQGSSENYATLIGILFPRITAATNTVCAFNMTKLFNKIGGKAVLSVSYNSSGALSDNISLSFSNLTPLGLDSTASFIIKLSDNADLIDGQPYNMVNKAEIQITKITATGSGTAGGNTVYTVFIREDIR